MTVSGLSTPRSANPTPLTKALIKSRIEKAAYARQSRLPSPSSSDSSATLGESDGESCRYRSRSSTPKRETYRRSPSISRPTTPVSNARRPTYRSQRLPTQRIVQAVLRSSRPTEKKEPEHMLIDCKTDTMTASDSNTERSFADPIYNEKGELMGYKTVITKYTTVTRTTTMVVQRSLQPGDEGYEEAASKAAEAATSRIAQSQPTRCITEHQNLHESAHVTATSERAM